MQEASMNLIVNSRNGKLSDRQRQHIEQKLSRLDRYLDRIDKVTVEHMEEMRRNEGNVHRVQVTVVGDHGILVRAERRAPELYAAIDEVYDTLQRQIERYKDKHWRRGRLRRQGGQIIEALPEMTAAPLTIDEEEHRPRIVRMKEFQVKPMYSDEAVEQMELLGHSFFIFQDAETGKLNVLYRRQDGNYGLIVPEVSG
jgi:ribosomal subunit interface protein